MSKHLLESFIKHGAVNDPQRYELMQELNSLLRKAHAIDTIVVPLARKHVLRLTDGYPSALTDAQLSKNIEICELLAKFGTNADGQLAHQNAKQYRLVQRYRLNEKTSKGEY